MLSAAAIVPEAPRSPAREARLVVSATLLLLACLWAFVAYWALAARQEAIDRTEQVLRRADTAASEQTRRVFWRAADFLAVADQWLSDNPDADALHDARFLRLVDAFHQRTGRTVAIHLAAADGTLSALGAPLPEVKREIGDEDYFRAAVGGETRQHNIGTPAASGSNGFWQIPLAHRLSRQTKAGAALVATIQLPALLAHYEELRLRPDGAVALLRRDGRLLARAPHDERLIGESLAGGQLYREFLPRAERGFGRIERTATDAMDKYVGYSVLDDLPLVVVVSAAVDDVLAPWRRQTIAVGLLAALLSAALLVAARRLARTLGRLSARNAELELLATNDALTGVGNRRHFLSLLQHEFARARRNQLPLSLLVLDLDFFKQINDGYGHAAGDEALYAFARAGSGCLRDMDAIGRLGGEEFGVLLPNTQVEQAQAVAERIRKAVDRIAIPSEFGTVRFTASIGVTQSEVDDASIDKLLARADAALYTAKAAGRNRVIVRLAGDRHSRF